MRFARAEGKVFHYKYVVEYNGLRECELTRVSLQICSEQRRALKKGSAYETFATNFIVGRAGECTPRPVTFHYKFSRRNSWALGRASNKGRGQGRTTRSFPHSRVGRHRSPLSALGSCGHGRPPTPPVARPRPPPM